MAGDVGFLYQVGDCFSPRNMLLWPRKWQICDAELGRLVETRINVITTTTALSHMVLAPPGGSPPTTTRS